MALFIFDFIITKRYNNYGNIKTTLQTVIGEACKCWPEKRSRRVGNRALIHFMEANLLTSLRNFIFCLCSKFGAIKGPTLCKNASIHSFIWEIYSNHSIIVSLLRWCLHTPSDFSFDSIPLNLHNFQWYTTSFLYPLKAIIQIYYNFRYINLNWIILSIFSRKNHLECRGKKNQVLKKKVFILPCFFLSL